MSDSRIVTIRKSASILHEQIIFPLLFLSAQFGYPLESIVRYIHSSPDLHLGEQSNTFPHTIEEYYWIKEGIEGKEPWIALGKLNGDIYFLYTAYMNLPNNTFVNNGHMNLWVSIRFSDIINFAMDLPTYMLYIKNTC